MKLVFSIPGYDSKSNGLNVFHLVAREFSNLGAQVKIIPWENETFKYKKPEEYSDLYSADFDIKDAIAFLPDAIPKTIVCDIRKQVKSCVWWLCNVPGLLGHEATKFKENDYLFSYSTLVSDYLPQFYYHSDIKDLPSLKKIKEARDTADIILVYTGKGSLCRIPKIISDQIVDLSKVVCISRFFPETKEVLHSMLLKAKLLISFDPISNLNYEATMFGVPVFLVNNMRPELSLQKDFNVPLHGFFTDPYNFVNILKIGLDIEIIHNSHKKALEGNSQRIKDVYDFLKNWSANSCDPFLSKFQAKIVLMYNRILESELPKLKPLIDSSIGSTKIDSDKSYNNIIDFVMGKYDSAIVVEMPSGEHNQFVQKPLVIKKGKKTIFTKLKRSLLKRAKSLGIIFGY